MKLTLELRADGSGLTGTVRVAAAELQRLNATADRTSAAGRAAGRGIDDIDRASKTAAGSVRSLATHVNTLRGTLATLGVAYVAREFLSAGLAMTRFDNGLSAALGSQQLARQEMAFLRGEAERLGIYLPVMVQGFTGLAAATRGTALEGEKTRLIFSGVAEAGRAMNLTNDQIAGTLNALQQIAGKGTVSMEELRLQLGDRLPGAMQIAARSMGMTVAELTKMVSEGKVLSEDFLPKFAAELSRSAAAGVEFSRNSPAAQFERLKTALFELAAVGSGDVLDALADGAKNLADGLNELVQNGTVETVGNLLGTLLRQTDALLVSLTVFYGARGLGAVAVKLRDLVTPILLSAASFEELGVKTAGAAAAGRTMLSTGSALFTAMGGWVTVVAALAGGLYLLYEAAEEVEQARLKEATSLAALNEQLEREYQTRQLIAAGRATEANASEWQQLDDAVTKYQKLNAQLEMQRELLWQIATSGGERGFAVAQREVASLEAALVKTRAEMVDFLAKSIRAGQEVPPAFQSMAAEAKRYGEAVAGVVSELLRMKAAQPTSDAADFNGASNALLPQTSALTDEENKLIDSIEERTRVMGLSRVATLELAKADAVAEASSESAAKQIAAAYDAEIRKTQAVEASTEAERNQEKALRAQEQAMQKHVASLDAALAGYDDWQRGMEDLAAELAGPMAQAQLDYDRALIEAEANAVKFGLTTEELRQQKELLRKEFERTTGAIAAEQDVLGSLEDDYENQIRLARLSESERRIEIASLQALAEWHRTNSGAIDAETEARIRQTVRMGESELDMIDAARTHAEEYERAWSDAIENVGDAFGEWIANGMDDFDSFGDALVDTAKKLVAQLIAEFAKVQIARMFAGAGGSLGAAAQSFLGGSSGGGALGGVGTWLSSFASGRGFEMASSFVGPPTALSGGSSAAGSGGLAGAASNAGWVPVVGWILAAMAANDSMFAQGWRRNSSTTLLPNGASVTGGGNNSDIADLLTANAVNAVDSVLQRLGINDRVASLLSGSSIHARLFGRKAPVVTSGEISASFGAGGISGSEAYQTLEEGGLFRSDRRRTHTFDLSDSAREAVQGIFDTLEAVIRDSALQLQIDAPQMLESAFRTVVEYNKKGEVTATKYIVDVIGRSWEEATAELATTRLSAEAIIATVDAALAEVVYNSLAKGSPALQMDGGAGGDLGDAGDAVNTASAIIGEASQIAERWRDDAEQLMIGAQYLLAAATDMRAGNALLGEGVSLTALTDFVEGMAQGSETMLDTYTRLSASAGMLEQALDLSGTALDLTREEFVKFAADITDAAGGLDRASALWADYFQRFYSPEELLANQAVGANAAAQSEFSDIGLSVSDFTGEGGAQAFRELFEQRLPTLSAEAVVEWLEAAAALGVVLDLQDQQNAVLQAQAEALAEYNSLVGGLRDELDATSMSDFALEMRDIRRWTQETTDALNTAARAAGLQAANEEDLGLVHQIAAQRAAAAIERLRSSAADLVAELYGSPLDQINEQIAAMESAQTSSIASVGEAAQDMYAQQLAALQNIQAWLNSQLLGDLSTLTPREQVAEAQRQFEATLALARGGDVDALQRITSEADTLLRLGRDYYASSQPYSDLEALVRGGMQGLVNAGPTGAQLGGQNNVGGGGGVSPELQALYAERDAAMAASELAQRQALLTELGGMIRELIQATGQPLAEVASSIGLNLSALAEDLGINLNELSVSTATGLVDMARALGVDVAELATNVGVSLGELGDRQSLLNQALDATLVDIPEEFRNQLTAPLEAIRNATTEADSTAAVQAAETAINSMPQGIRDLLAPYFEGVFPAEAVTELTQLSSLAKTSVDQLGVLQSIAAILAAQATAQGVSVPSFAVGTAYVPRDMLANIHQGETILPAPVSDFARRSGLQIGPGGGDSRALLAELRRLREAQSAQARSMETRLMAVEAAQKEGAEKIASATRKQTDAITMRGR